MNHHKIPFNHHKIRLNHQKKKIIRVYSIILHFFHPLFCACTEAPRALVIGFLKLIHPKGSSQPLVLRRSPIGLVKTSIFFEKLDIYAMMYFFMYIYIYISMIYG